MFHPGASTRTLARTPAGAPAFAPETLELSSDELQRVRAGSFTVCVSLDNGDAAFFQLVLRGLRDALTDLNMTLLETAEAHGSLARRGSQLKYFAHLSPDAIISFSNDQTPLRDQFVARANSRSKLIPVSYTHLDVYKRQSSFWASTCRPICRNMPARPASPPTSRKKAGWRDVCSPPS